MAPSNASVLYAAVHDDLVAPFPMNVLRSTDGGSSWNRMLTDPTPFGTLGPYLEMLIVNPFDEDTVYALNNMLTSSAPAPIVLRSRDGGATWIPIRSPNLARFHSSFPSAGAIGPDNGSHLIVATNSGLIGGAGVLTALTTANGGETWTETEFAYVGVPTAVVIDHVDPSRAYLSFFDFGVGSYRLLKSLDGGFSWSEIPVSGPPCLLSLHSDPFTRDVLYASCFRPWTSRDGGATWEEIDPESFPATAGTFSLSVSATSPRVIHAGTTRGVYSNTSDVRLDLSGSCPGTVTIQISNAPPNSEVGVIGAQNNSGWTKGGVLCNGAEFEIGEPFQLPPIWIRIDAQGNGSGSMTLQSNRCWVEALAPGNCSTSGAALVE